MQQHTGQHILSQSFVKLFKAPTRSFRVLEESCEIDVDLDTPTEEVIERAVELANNVIWENRMITISRVTPEEASELPLRKAPAREGDLRLIDIEGFDLTPCGGTHAYQTGEVGMIAVRSWERAKGLTRIEFVAGLRALADYRRANKSARAIAGLFSAGRDDVPELAARAIEENKHLHRRVRTLEEIAARVEAEELLAAATITNGRERIVTKVFNNRDPESLKQLALSLISHSSIIALLGSRDSEAARLVFARSPDASGDMNVLMRDACAKLDGRGGGRPDLAQGGGKNLERLDEAIAQAEQSVK